MTLANPRKENSGTKMMEKRASRFDAKPFRGDVSAFCWIVVRVDSGKERAARYLLGRAGFAAIVPLKGVMVRKSRIAKEKVLAAFPLIGGYVFVGLPAGRRWDEVGRIGLVRSVVGFDVDGERRPGLVQVRPFKKLLAAYGDGSEPWLQRAGEPKRPVEVGKRARVIDGPFAGQSVMVDTISGESARVLMPLFGATDLPATLTLDKLVALDEPSASDALRSDGR